MSSGDPPTSIDRTYYSSMTYKGAGVLYPRPLAFVSVYLAINPNNWQRKTSRFRHTEHNVVCPRCESGGGPSSFKLCICNAYYYISIYRNMHLTFLLSLQIAEPWLISRLFGNRASIEKSNTDAIQSVPVGFTHLFRC
jgi:hypothetical protein